MLTFLILSFPKMRGAGNREKVPPSADRPAKAERRV